MNQPDEAPRKQSAAAVPGNVRFKLQYSRRRHVNRFCKPHPPITAVFYRKRKKTVPASVPSAEILRKTRNLPNLSECQACGFRIDLTDGKNRLQTLYSEWRLVLLCGKCLSRVDSSVVCSYCFMEISGEEFCCGCCKRRIHRNCFLDCKDLPPWSYSCSGSEFSVCVDCWVPKSFLKKRQVKRRRIKRKGVEVVCAVRSTGFVDIGEHNRILEIAERGPSCFSNSKPEAAAKDNGEVVKEAFMATSSDPSTALNMVVKGSGSTSGRCEEAVNDDRVIDDTELALQLHRSMNSSPRISKKKHHPDKSCYMVFRRALKVNGHISVRVWESGNASADGMHQMCVKDEAFENQEKDGTKTSTDLHFPEVDGVANGSSRQQNGMCQINYDSKDEMMEVSMNEGEGSCSNGIVTETKNCSEQNESVKPKNETCAEKPGRYLIKYCKRKLSSNVNGRTEILCDKIHL